MRELTVELEDRNFAKEPLTRAEIERIVDAAGSVAAVLNTRHAIAKERGWKEAPPIKAVFVAEAVREPNLLRRPILLVDGQAVVGRNDTATRKLLAKGR